LFTTNEPFKVEQPWKLKKNSEPVSSDLSVFSPMPKRDYVFNLGSSESSYLRIASSLDINSYHHPNYAALLVLLEYFCQTEGPLWEAVRGPGYCYHQSISLSPELAMIELSLDECSNLTKAYDATRKLFVSEINSFLGIFID